MLVDAANWLQIICGTPLHRIVLLPIHEKVDQIFSETVYLSVLKVSVWIFYLARIT